MVFDLRTFTVKSGRFSEFIADHKKIASPILRIHLGRPVGYWSTITGEMNQFVHLWQFESFDDMEKRQNALAADPAWREYVKGLGENAILQRQQSVFLKPIEIPD